MKNKRPLITVVCIANYCRSPVAEALLRERFKDEYDITSAGIMPIARSGMDPRSLKFLNMNSVKPQLHTPKKISSALVRSSEIIFAMDFNVLLELNNKFKKHNYKIKNISYQNPKISVVDPFNMQESEYNMVMGDIKYLVDNVDL